MTACSRRSGVMNPHGEEAIRQSPLGCVSGTLWPD